MYTNAKLNKFVMSQRSGDIYTSQETSKSLLNIRWVH